MFFPAQHLAGQCQVGNGATRGLVIRKRGHAIAWRFGQADVALVIGANDVVNPSARTDKASPIYGMPILNADMAQNVIVIKRGKGTGYSGVENALFYTDNCRMLYGDAQPMAGEIIQHLKAMA